MSDHKPNLDSLFEAAVEIETAAERAAFLDKSCGDDPELREQLERLLQSNEQAGSFLDKTPAALEATILTDGSGDNLAAALDAGLAPAFTQEQAVLLGDGRHSVLKMLGQTLDQVPRVALRDSVKAGADPIVRPKSAEMPQKDSDSRYQLQGEIARGGMGAILKGRDTDLGRDLAIKVLLDQHKDKPEVVQRFIEEAQIGGQLQHPGVAPIYELGQFTDKRPFFAMKLVKGQTLSKLLAERKDPTEDRGRFIGIFEQVCQTMAYAHSRGVIHRDLKPANIMVGAFGEVQVMDWGLAKVLPTGGVADEKTARDQQQGQSIIQTLRSGVGSDVPAVFGSVGSQTQMGSVMGTPAYMPPEQALGEIDHLDERADVFGLGAILCEILTGKPPYVADDGTQVYRMASRGKLADCFQRLDACGADAELIALTKHCLELEPQHRPRDAGVLAERVTAYLESVETKLRESEVQRAAEAARAVEERKRRRVTLALAVSVLLTVCVGGGGWFHLERQAAERLATTTQRINGALGEARLHAGLADQTNQETEQGLADRALELERAHRSAVEAKKIAEQEQISPELLTSVATLEAELAANLDTTRRLVSRVTANRVLLEELELIRLGLARGANDGERSPTAEASSGGSEGTSRKYQQAFLKAGLDVKNSSTEEVVAWIEQSEIREEVIAELDNWRRLFPVSRFAFDASLEARNWDAAVHIVRLAVQQQPENAPYKLGLAIALAAAGHEDDLRKHALSMVSKYRNSRSKEEILRAVSACMLLPGVVNPAEIPAEWLGSRIPEADPGSWHWQMRALLAYRSGHPDEALACLVRADDESPKHTAHEALTNLALRALALHQLKRTQEAHECLDETARILGRLTWKKKCNIDVLHARLFVREAQIAINGRPDPQLAAELAPGTGPAQAEAEMVGKLLVVIDAADINPWRKRLRAALIAEDIAQLVVLARAQETAEQSAALRAWLGAALREAGEQKMSIQILQVAQQQSPADFWLNFELGQSLTRAGRTLEGLGYMRAAVAIRPDSAAALMGVVNILEDEQERDAIFRRVVAMDSRNAETQFRIGEFQLRQGRLSEGIAAYRKAVALTPDSSDYHYRLALALKDSGDMKSAVAEFDRSVAVRENGYEYHVELGRILRDQGALDEAVAEFRKAIEFHPFEWPLFLLGDTLNRRGDSDEAIVMIRRAIKAAPQLAGYKQDALIRIWQQTEGGLQAAIADFRQEIAADPDNAWCYYELGHALQAAGELEGSRDAFRKVMELQPKSPWHHQALGHVLIRQEDLDGAVAEFQKAIHINTTHAAFHDSLGDVFLRQGKRNEAISAYRNAIALDSYNSNYRVQLARTLEAVGKLDDAIDELSHIVSVIPENAWLRRELAGALMKAGESDRAISEFKKICSIELNDVRSAQFNSLDWLRIAPIVVLTEDQKAWMSFCQRIARLPVDSPQSAERIIKACLLRPESIELSALPLENLTTSLDDGSFPNDLKPWGWSTRALLALRLGDAKSAAKFAGNCESSGPSAFCRAMSFSVLAMAHQTLGETDQAQTALTRASELIAELKQDASNRIHHDLLIAEVLFREAKAAINP